MPATTLNSKGFYQALWLAAALHLLVFFVLGKLHIELKTDFPFQMVNIRLGENSPKKKIAPTPAPPETVASNIAEAPPPPLPVAKPPTPHTKPKTIPEKQKLWKRPRAKDDAFHPVARTLEDYIKKGDESLLGSLTPESDAAVTRRFTEVLSLWLYKFRDYPEEARLAGIKGQGLIRIRIDRTGRVLFYQLDRSTGAPVLDQAIRDMVYRSSPVPEPPGHFPGGSQLEFLIPIAFTLD